LLVTSIMQLAAIQNQKKLCAAALGEWQNNPALSIPGSGYLSIVFCNFTHCGALYLHVTRIFHAFCILENELCE
jgi:hypothetical protein